MVKCSTESQEAIIKGWLMGKTREEIANENFVSTGSVSNIIKGWKTELGTLAADEVREFVITLRRAGMTPLQCARGFRILSILNDLGFFEDNIEIFALRMFRTCKNIGLQPDKIALHVKELVDLTEKVPLDQISEYITINKGGKIRTRS